MLSSRSAFPPLIACTLFVGSIVGCSGTDRLATVMYSTGHGGRDWDTRFTTIVASDGRVMVMRHTEEGEPILWAGATTHQKASKAITRTRPLHTFYPGGGGSATPDVSTAVLSLVEGDRRTEWFWDGATSHFMVGGRGGEPYARFASAWTLAAVTISECTSVATQTSESEVEWDSWPAPVREEWKEIKRLGAIFAERASRLNQPTCPDE